MGVRSNVVALFSIIGGRANFGTARNGSRSAECSATNGSEWFAIAARAILGNDAGLQLHWITGYPERSCYRYASSAPPPPSDFLRKLFSHEQGEPFFVAFMDGSQAAWWRDYQRHHRMGRAADRER